MRSGDRELALDLAEKAEAKEVAPAMTGNSVMVEVSVRNRGDFPEIPENNENNSMRAIPFLANP